MSNIPQLARPMVPRQGLFQIRLSSCHLPWFHLEHLGKVLQIIPDSWIFKCLRIRHSPSSVQDPHGALRPSRKLGLRNREGGVALRRATLRLMEGSARVGGCCRVRAGFDVEATCRGKKSSWGGGGGKSGRVCLDTGSEKPEWFKAPLRPAGWGRHRLWGAGYAGGPASIICIIRLIRRSAFGCRGTHGA